MTKVKRTYTPILNKVNAARETAADRAAAMITIIISASKED